MAGPNIQARTPAERTEEIENRLNAVEAQLNALQIKQGRLISFLLGDGDELGGFDPEETRDILQRVIDIEDDTENLKQKLSLVERDGGKDTPDARAQRIRQVLYENARNNDGRARLNRDAANGAIGGGYNRGSVIEAMKRAADGYEGDINGSTELGPIEGITFSVPPTPGEQSAVEIDLSDVTGSEVRKNLTTGSEGVGV